MAQSTPRRDPHVVTNLGAGDKERARSAPSGKTCGRSRNNALRPIIFAAALFASVTGSQWIMPAVAQQGVVEDVSSLDAVVESVDQHDRTILLRVPDGLVTVDVGPEVKNLPQVKAGDHVHVGLREALVARLAPAADPTAAPKQSSELLTAEPGRKPAGFRRDAIRANVRITGIDTATHTVRFVGPARVERVAHLQNPSMQRLLEKLKVGDVVEMTYSIALAVVVTPVGT